MFRLFIFATRMLLGSALATLALGTGASPPAGSTPAAPQAQEAGLHAGFVGSDSCRSCHAEQHRLWQGSHHDLAMQPATPDTVLGHFDGTTFTHAGVTTTFLREGEQFIVRTAGEDGEMADFPVHYVFGVEPLQQVLLPLSRGRLQAFDIAWDSRPAQAGGQRWFHLNPEEVGDHRDPLHWTGAYMNWNTSCAECHSTDLQKRFNPDTRHFDTRYAEINVACEACHGPGEQHLAQVRGETGQRLPHGGFPVDLAQRGEWQFAEGAAIARRREPLDDQAQVDTCGRCHARRGSLGDYHHGLPLLDTHRLSLPREPLYHHDGQIRDEVFEYGSFLQSRMHREGVVCSSCHEPHSLQLRAEGNGVCAQCHRPERYDTPEHHHHLVQGSGAQCVACHMPETTYMVIDPRRDHSLRSPRPDLSVVMGTPNACNQCHADQSPEWALQALRNWGKAPSGTADHPARALQQLAAGNRTAVPRLLELVQGDAEPPIRRAAMLEALGEAGVAAEPLTPLLRHQDPLLRLGAVRNAASLPARERHALLRERIDDPVSSVRLAVAEALAEIPLAALPAAEAAALGALFDEYLNTWRPHADMPGVQLQLAIFLSQRGDAVAAEQAYRDALAANPQLLPAWLNLADLLRATGREAAARQALQEALAIAPDSGDALHAMGLLEVRGGNRQQALDWLQKAAALERQGTRHRYVYAIALHDSGQVEEALRQLRSLNGMAPGQEEVLLALVNYSEQAGQLPAALEYARALQAAFPDNPAYRQLTWRLQQAGGR